MPIFKTLPNGLTVPIETQLVLENVDGTFNYYMQQEGKSYFYASNVNAWCFVNTNFNDISSDPRCIWSDADDATTKTKGTKHDSGKVRYSLLPKGVIEKVLNILEFGANKYSKDNWQQVPNARDRYYDAAMRHIQAWYYGETKDPETGESHLAHALCCLMFLLWFDIK